MAVPSFETDVRKEQHDREKAWKETGKKTREELKDVLSTDTAESEIRKDQAARAKEWKETGKQTKAENADVNIAKAIFG